MKKKAKDVQINMYEHSKAKVELYGTYLATYLNILSRVQFIERIHIYDLMCGEGKYLDNSKGSPIVALEKIKEHYFSNNKSCPNIEVWFNDKDMSEIEEGKFKVDRVKSIASKMFIPPNVNIEFSKKDYSHLYEELKIIIKKLKNEKALLFIDPYGYKDVHPSQLRELLRFGDTEVILFLPLSHMYRFANKSIEEPEFKGGGPLRDFLLTLFENNKDLNRIESVHDLILKMKNSFKDYLQEHDIFVDTFTLERDSQNVYCLFFFTPNILGFEKMLDAKWKLDEQHGKGFKLDSIQTSLFSEVEVFNYSNAVKEYILSVKFRTNSDLYFFGLQKGFLPKHTNEVLRMFQKTLSSFSVLDLHGEKVRKSAFYLKYENYGSNPKKEVRFSINN